jgi:hypothetical protein
MCLSEAQASHSQRTWAEVSSFTPHPLHSGLFTNPSRMWQRLTSAHIRPTSHYTYSTHICQNKELDSIHDTGLKYKRHLIKTHDFFHRMFFYKIIAVLNQAPFHKHEWINGGMVPCILNLEEGEWSALSPCRFTPKETAAGNHCRSKRSPPPKKNIYILPLLVFEPRIPLSSNRSPNHYTDYMAHIHSYLQ